MIKYLAGDGVVVGEFFEDVDVGFKRTYLGFFRSRHLEVVEKNIAHLLRGVQVELLTRKLPHLGGNLLDGFVVFGELPEEFGVNDDPLPFELCQHRHQRHFNGPEQLCERKLRKLRFEKLAEQDRQDDILAGIIRCLNDIGLGKILLVPAFADKFFDGSRRTVEKFLCQAVKNCVAAFRGR